MERSDLCGRTLRGPRDAEVAAGGRRLGPLRQQQAARLLRDAHRRPRLSSAHCEPMERTHRSRHPRVGALSHNCTIHMNSIVQYYIHFKGWHTCILVHSTNQQSIYHCGVQGGGFGQVCLVFKFLPSVCKFSVTVLECAGIRLRDNDSLPSAQLLICLCKFAYFCTHQIRYSNN